MYAIIEVGGKQYKVEKDMTIDIDRISVDSDNLTFDKVLMFVDGEDVMIGNPYLNNVKVSAKVLGQTRGKKVRGIKFKKRKNYTRTLGYKPPYVQLKIQEVAVV